MTRRERIDRLLTMRVEIDSIVAALKEKPAASGSGASTDDSTVPDRPFRGRAMESKLESTCAVCDGQIRVGDSIVYNGELRRAAHLGCGQVDRRGGR